jgi:cysteine dioxygenase
VTAKAPPLTPIASPAWSSPQALLGSALPARPAAGHETADLVDLARRLELQPEAWSALAPYLQFDARQYRRVRLFRNDQWEGLLLCWLPGQGTSLHDHGGSVGVSLVLAGDIRENRYASEAAGGPLVVRGTEVATAGSASVELADTIHEMSNCGTGPAITLHLYSPPLTVLGAHDPATGARWEVPVADSPNVQVGGDPKLEIP